MGLGRPIRLLEENQSLGAPGSGLERCQTLVSSKQQLTLLISYSLDSSLQQSLINAAPLPLETERI